MAMREEAEEQEDPKTICPSCGAKLNHRAGCLMCLVCGWGLCEGE